jgi:putative ABC transport system permease protein
MVFWTVVTVALRSLRSNKLRAFLTLLGIIIGVASVIAMLGLGAGTQEKVTQSMRNFGANLLTVRPEQHGGSSGVRTGRRVNLKPEDGQAILQQVPEIDMVTPDLDEHFQVKYMNKNVRVSVNGEAVTYFAIRNFPIGRGNAFTEADVERQGRVAVLGPKTAEDLFGTEDPLGKQIKIKGVNFTVVGITKEKGSSMFSNPDENVWIPYTTAMSQIIGRNYLDQIYCRVREGVDMAVAQQKVEEAMRRQHRIQPGQPDDFSVRNLQEITDTMNTISTVFTMLLAGVAGVSLLVGGVNIMNIMLVTVTERTREIGVRKAVGARRRDVLTQFLIEAITISMAGGLIGIALGTGSIWLFNYVTAEMTGDPFGAKIQALPIIISFGFSVLVGVFFGWYPAVKAARLDPIDCLRFE